METLFFQFFLSMALPIELLANVALTIPVQFRIGVNGYIETVQFGVPDLQARWAVPAADDTDDSDASDTSDGDDSDNDDEDGSDDSGGSSDDSDMESGIDGDICMSSDAEDEDNDDDSEISVDEEDDNDNSDNDDDVIFIEEVINLV